MIEKKYIEIPMFVGSSGGGGHNSAMEAIIKNIYEKKLDIVFPTYQAILPGERKIKNQLEVDIALTLMHELPPVSSFIRKVISKTPFPILPSRQQLLQEIEKLESSQLLGINGEKKPDSTLIYCWMDIQEVLPTHPSGTFCKNKTQQMS